MKSTDGIKFIFVNHTRTQILHIKNYESNGYWDFWQKQNQIPGQDTKPFAVYSTALREIRRWGAEAVPNCGSGQIMAYINDPEGRLCDWESRAPSVTAYGCLMIIKVKYCRRCCSLMFPKRVCRLWTRSLRLWTGKPQCRGKDWSGNGGLWLFRHRLQLWYYTRQNHILLPIRNSILSISDRWKGRGNVYIRAANRIHHT